MKKAIVILGPTAVGKSDLAVEIALNHFLDQNSAEMNSNTAEIISADSRQVYKGLNIGTGKITKKEMKGIKHHLLDIADPKNPDEQISVIKWRELAEKAMQDIFNRRKIPIICGGTGFYISSLINQTEFPDVSANPKLREELDKETLEKLVEKLLSLDPKIGDKIDLKNKRKVIRAIEIVKFLGHIPERKITPRSDIEFLQIGLNISKEKLRERIISRLEKRISIGMIDEAQNLHKTGLSYEKMRGLGLEYRYLADLLENKINEKEFKEILGFKIWQYAKRQMTWFKKDLNIMWFKLDEKEAIFKTIAKYLSK